MQIWHWTKRTVLILFLSLGVSCAGLYFAGKSFIKQQISDSLGHDVDFEIKNISLKEISLANISIGDESRVKNLMLSLKWKDYFTPPSIAQFNINSETLSQQQFAKLFASEGSAEKSLTRKQTLSKICEQLKEIPFAVNIKRLRLDNQLWDGAIKIKSLPLKTEIFFDGVTRSTENEKLRIKLKGKLSFVCLKESVEVDIADSSLSLFEPFEIKNEKNKIVLKKFVVENISGKVNIGFEEFIDMKISHEGNVVLLQDDLERKSNWELSYLDYSKDKNSNGFQYSFSKPKFSTNSGKWIKFYKLKGEGKVLSKKFINNSTVFLQEESKEGIELRYVQEGDDWVISFNEKKEAVLLQNLMKSFPNIAEYNVKEMVGPLSLSGIYKSSGDYSLEASTENAHFLWDIMDADGVKIRHAMSGKGEAINKSITHIDADEVVYVEKFENIKSVVEAKSFTNFFFQQLEFGVQGARVGFSPFSLNTDVLSLGPTNIRIRHWPVDKFFGLILKNGFAADGTFSGEINFHLVNSKWPLIKNGFLLTDGPSWLRYRPHGNQVPGGDLLSSTPIEILNSYLYDFRYEKIRLGLRSDEEKKLYVKVNALGRNPQYSDGKRLKLNINLEQSLIPLIVTAVLSYDMPSRLEEKIKVWAEKYENKQ